MKKYQGFLTILMVFALIFVCTWQAMVGFGAGGSSAARIKQGLDLAGGVSITYEVVGEEEPAALDMADTKKKLEQRVQQYSTEAIVYQEGNRRFSIEIPGVTDADAILADLGRPGSLYFISETNSKGEANYALKLLTKEEMADSVNKETASNGGDIYEFVLLKTIEELEAEGSIVLYGTDVADAQGGSFQTQMGSEFGVSLTLTKEGAEKFALATARAAGKETIGIYYDGRFVSVPGVQTAITDGMAQITGMSGYEEAANLASTIRIGGLSLELEEVYNKVVGAQLGGEALEKSMLAGAIGLAVVMIFMIAVYFLPGLCAALALLLYVPFIVVLIHGFDMTLTLPGVAGIILSIGMAVDANVIIFARIREELATGKTVKSSVKIGFNKAFSAIIDGNVTTLIAALVLMIMGSGVVKGFAQTLMLGIVLSMFTSMVVTRLLVMAFFALGFKKEKWYGIAKKTKGFDYIGHRKKFMIGSVALILAGVVMMAVNKGTIDGAFNYGLEFKGGTSTSIIFEEEMTLEEVNNDLVPKIMRITGDGNIQPQVVAGTAEVIVKTRSLSQEERASLTDLLVETYGVNPERVTSETISSTISKETRNETIIAVLVAVVCMLVYIRFRFSDIRFGVSSVLALMHDVLVVLAFYAFTRITVGNTFIACLLTIVGYSINATIVIFDRIRENLTASKWKIDLKKIVNDAISQTLSRSIFTSLTTFIMVVFLYIFGVTSIKEFALPLMVGIACGTYSSVCLAGAMWFILRNKFVPRPDEDE